jgi:acyl-homoserine lactone acylase PvdQ
MKWRMKKRQQQTTSPPSGSVRNHKVSFLLNDEEYNVIQQYVAKYRIRNKSNWYRTTLMKHVLKVMETDYPTLFNEYEMRR